MTPPVVIVAGNKPYICVKVIVTFPTNIQLRLINGLLVQKITFQSKAGHPRSGYADRLFYSCDPDLDPVTLLDTNIPTKN